MIKKTNQSKVIHHKKKKRVRLQLQPHDRLRQQQEDDQPSPPRYSLQQQHLMYQRCKICSCYLFVLVLSCSSFLLIGQDMQFLLAQSSMTTQSHHKRKHKDNTHDNSGCHTWSGIMPPDQVQQDLLSSDSQQPTGLVVSLLLGDHLLPYVCNFFPSQLAHFIVPQGLDVLFVIPSRNSDGSSGRDDKQNATQPLTMRALQQCLNLMPLEEEDDEAGDEIMTTHNNPHTSRHNGKRRFTQYVHQEWYNLDGSTLTTWEHRATPYHDTRIFLAETDLQYPSYIRQNPALLQIPMEPKSCRAPLSFIQGTRWYIYELLHLQILQEYDYFVRLDTDIVFVQSIPVALLHDMTVRGGIMGHFAKYPDHVQTPCADTLAQAVQTFTERYRRQTTEQTNNATSPITIETKHGTWNGKYCSGNHHPFLQMDSDRYYANFIIGRTDFFQSPGPLALGKFLSDEWTDGFFRHRWGDQAYWHYALGLFLGPNFEDAVVDYTEFRCAPEPNCWMSSLEGKRIPNAANLCFNGGSFLHTKSWKRFVNQWNRWNALSASSLKRDTRPYRTNYFHECHNSKRWRGP